MGRRTRERESNYTEREHFSTNMMQFLTNVDISVENHH